MELVSEEDLPFLVGGNRLRFDRLLASCLQTHTAPIQGYWFAFVESLYLRGNPVKGTLQCIEELEAQEALAPFARDSGTAECSPFRGLMSIF